MSKKQVHFPETALALQIPNKYQLESLESGEIPPDQQVPIQHDEIISSFAIGDTIRLPSNELRPPMNFTIKEKIGSGTYGEVYEVEPLSKLPAYFPIPKDKSKPPTYALKKMKSSEKTQAFQYEQMIMNLIASAYPNFVPPCAPHVLCYFDISRDRQGRFYFLSEIMDGDLLDVVNSLRTDKERIQVAKSVFKQTLAGLKELKEIGLLHRDLKHENLLYHIPIGPSGRKRKSEMVIKLADFGLSCIPKSQNLGCGFKITGTPGFIDPNVMLKILDPDLDFEEKKKLEKLDEVWDETNDIYALSIILYEVLFGPYLEDQDFAVLQMKDADLIALMYNDANIRNKPKVEKELGKYKPNTTEYKLLKFILRNFEPFVKKQTIEEAIHS
jgi:serine/threonine protein kinase